MMDRREELPLLVSERLVENLRETFTPEYFLSRAQENSDVFYGYMKGVTDVVNYLAQAISDG